MDRRNNPDTRGNYGTAIRSVRHALQILRLFAQGEPELGVTDTARKLAFFPLCGIIVE